VAWWWSQKQAEDLKDGVGGTESRTGIPPSASRCSILLGEPGRPLRNTYAYVLNQLRKLGLSTEDIAATDEEFNAQLATLKESAPFFRFHVPGRDRRASSILTLA
jgi:hypothetical protein